MSAATGLNPDATPLRMEPTAAPPTLREFTAALGRGEDPAWERFHREFGPRLFRQLLAATRGDHALASEALQQAYLRVARHARPCEHETVFLAWLRTVARSALNDCYRRRRSFWAMLRRRHDDPSEQPDFAAESDDRLLLALDRALHSLAPEDRDLLQAKYFSGRSVRSLAAAFAVSEKALESRLTRARSALRGALLTALSRHE